MEYGMEKLLTFPGKTDQGIFAFVIDTEHEHLIKTAAEYHPEVKNYINSAKAIPGKTQILLTALGAGEYWSNNANGDWFPEKSLAHFGKDYGYKTFEYYAKIYKHHVNKDPKASYGDVVLSVYNPVFHRVELIVVLDNAKAPDIVSEMENGIYGSWSMGCLKACAELLMKDFSKKKVSELKAGDMIIDGTGEISEIDYSHSHHHKGTWVHVNSLGLKDIEPTTEEHPWLIIKRSEMICRGNPSNSFSTKKNQLKCFPNKKTKSCKNCPNALNLKKHWVRADELKEGDYLATSIISEVIEKNVVSDRFAYLAGIFMAEGHITSDDYIELNVNTQEKYLYDKLCNLFPEESITWRPHKKTPTCTRINIYNKPLAREIANLIGRKLENKKVPESVIKWPIEKQKIFIGGWIDGDGGRYKHALYISTAKKELAARLQIILLRFGCISSININYHKPSTVVHKDTVEYQVWIGNDSAVNLENYSFKSRNIEKPKCYNNRRFIHDGYLWSPIMDIFYEDCDEKVYNVAVKSNEYNSDSYNISQVVLHNCRVPFDQCNICGNKARTVKEYCEHLKYYMGKIHPPTGKIAYAINWKPRFFDISKVLIGADKISLSLMKVAYAKSQTGLYLSSAYLAEKSASENKQATIKKEIPAGHEAPPSSEDKVETIMEALPEMKDRETPLPRPMLDNVANNHDLGKIFTTMSMMGIRPKPQEFQRIVLINIGKKDIADGLDSENKCFDPDSNFPLSGGPIYRRMTGDMSGSGYNENILKTLAPYISDRSCLHPHITRRIIIMTKQAVECSRPEYIKLSAEQERKPVGMPALLLMLAGAYSLMSKGGKKIVEKVPGFVVKHPGLAAALMVGTPMVMGGFFGPGSKGNVDIGTMKNQQQEIDRFSPQDMEKRLMKIGVSKELMFSAGMVPGAYMASQWLNKRRQSDPHYQEGKIKSFIRKNPDLVAAVSGFNVLHKMTGGGAVKGVKNLFKTGSITEDITNVALFPLALGSKALPGRMVGSLMDQAMFEASRKFLTKKKSNLKA